MSKRTNKRSLHEANITGSNPSKKRKIDTSNNNHNSIQQQNQTIPNQETTHHHNVNPTTNVQLNNDSESDLSDNDRSDDSDYSDYDKKIFNRRKQKLHQNQSDNYHNSHQNNENPGEKSESHSSFNRNEGVYNNDTHPIHRNSYTRSSQRHYQQPSLQQESAQSRSYTNDNNAYNTQYSSTTVHQQSSDDSDDDSDDNDVSSSYCRGNDDPFSNYYKSILLCLHSDCWLMWDMNWGFRWAFITLHPALDYQILIWRVIYIYIMTWSTCYKAMDHSYHPGPYSFYSFIFLLLTTFIVPISHHFALDWPNYLIIFYCVSALLYIIYHKYGLGHAAICAFWCGIPVFVFFNVFGGNIFDFCGFNVFCYFEAEGWAQQESKSPSNEYSEYIYQLFIYLIGQLKLQVLGLYVMRFQLIYWFPFVYLWYRWWDTQRIINSIILIVQAMVCIPILLTIVMIIIYLGELYQVEVMQPLAQFIRPKKKDWWDYSLKEYKDSVFDWFG